MKNKLAIFGGKRTVDIDEPHYVWPPITEKTKEAVLKQLDESISIYDKSGIIDKLENKFSDYYGKKHALLTNSGTSAIHSMYVGADLKPNDEIICPAYTFFATVTPLFFTGATPILVDSNEDGNISPEAIKEKINKNTKGIVVTHMWGMPCDMAPIQKIAKDYDLLLFEDASHAHGAKYRSKTVGSFGDASAFSLQAQKTLTGGEGGVLLTNNENIYYRALLLGHYNKRCKQEIPKEHPLYKFAVTGMGLKLRIHPIAAAIANEQFDDLDRILANRRNIAKKMAIELGNLPGISAPVVPDRVEPTWYAFIMQYKPEELEGLPIEKFYDALIAEGCKELDRPTSTCPLNYHPLFQNPKNLFPTYKGKVKYCKGDFPKAEKFHENSLKLPVWHDPNDEIVDLYIDSFKKVTENYEDLLK
ncbi:Aspartate aminotransferase [uncultured archaeon]|nr:Aspartate aminotransferase [uncultured archaeon]